MSNNKFQQYFEFLFQPRKLQLIVFGILVSPIILFGLYSLSFSWFITFEIFLIPVYVAVIVVLIIVFFLDKRFKTKLKSYMIITIALLIFYTVLSYPIRIWLVSQSENQGEQIAKLIDKYKTVNGHYPDSLNIDYFKGFSNRSFVGSRFTYTKLFDEKRNVETYDFKYVSFHGYIGHFNSERKVWTYTD